MAKQEQITLKDEEIIRLQEAVQELRAKLSMAATYQGDRRKDEQIERLLLEVTHLKQQLIQLQQNWARERKAAEKNLADLTDELVLLKLRYQTEVAEKDGNDLRNMKRIKMLNYQIRLYEDQINTFNQQQQQQQSAKGDK